MESLWHRSKGHSGKKSIQGGTMTNGIEIITVIEGIVIMLFGAGIWFASPMLITGLLGAVFLIVGMVVVIKGFFKKFRNP
jgi:hypothetical protein